MAAVSVVEGRRSSTLDETDEWIGTGVSFAIPPIGSP
jgi:hypothetical protein